MVEGANPTNKNHIRTTYFIFLAPIFSLSSVLAKRMRSRIKGFTRHHRREKLKKQKTIYLLTEVTTISTLYFLQFNNYYDRTVKVYGTLADYLDYNVYVQNNFNFVPGDQVTTTLPAVPVNQANEDLTADYLLVVDNNTISSRWYIMDSTRLLNNT